MTGPVLFLTNIIWHQTQISAAGGRGAQSSLRIPTVPDKSLVTWVQIDMKCPSNIFLINIFLQEMAHFNPNSFWNNVLLQNVHSLVKPIEYIFAKIKVLSPCHMMHPILD